MFVGLKAMARRLERLEVKLGKHNPASIFRMTNRLPRATNHSCATSSRLVGPTLSRKGLSGMKSPYIKADFIKCPCGIKVPTVKRHKISYDTKVPILCTPHTSRVLTPTKFLFP